MRCFVPLCDDELYAWIERHGFAGLVAYQPGMRLAAAPPAPLASAPVASAPPAGVAVAEERKAA
jgi:hypothetical protein